MSEEIATAAADLATVERLQKDRDWWQQHAHDTLVELHETQAELSRLTTDLRGLRAIVAQQQNEIESERAARRAVVAAAREWREAVETLDGVYAAEQALIAAWKARGE